jgi:hypothetical protein
MSPDFQLELFVRGGLLVLLLLWIIGLRLGGAREPTPVRWSIRKSTTRVSRTGAMEIVVVADIAEGWHVLSLTQPEGRPSALAIGLAESEGAAIAGRVRGPASRRDEESPFDIPVDVYDGRAEFTVPLQLQNSQRGGTQRLHLLVSWQAYNDSVRLPARSIELPFDVAVTPAPATTPASGSPTSSPLRAHEHRRACDV